MSDSSSHATQASESDFHDSHPVDEAAKEKSSPSLGDLTSIETKIDASEEQSHSLGDISSIEDSPKSEMIGDMSLLDEAFAEMQEGDATNGTDIPVLNESIETPNESRIVSIDDNASIPTLDQEATVYAEMLKPASQMSSESNPVSAISGLEAELDEEESDEPLFESPEAQENTNVSAMNSALETAAELMSESAVPTTFTASTNTTAESELLAESEPQVTKFEAAEESSENTPDGATSEAMMAENDDSALEALLEDEMSIPVFDDPDIESNISDLELDIESEIASDASSSVASMTAATSIDEKIAAASAGNTESEINEIPISVASEATEFPASYAEGLQDSEFIGEALTESQAETTMDSEISEFNPDVDLNNTVAAPHTSHSIGITGQGTEENGAGNHLNLSIPFELHSQLSQKIDELVIEATSSITDELHTQLTARLDSLLGNAVESVLPKLVNQMALELRTEVNGRVKQQLPNIINDVLNKTRLHK